MTQWAWGLLKIETHLIKARVGGLEPELVYPNRKGETSA